METKVPRPRGRPRKRRRPEDEIGAMDAKPNAGGKRRTVETRSIEPVALVGRYVLKEFKGSGIFLGKVVYYDTGLYRVEYEDGDFEDLESRELRELILDDNYFDDDLNSRKEKLDEVLLKKGEKKDGTKIEVDVIETSTLSQLSGGIAVEEDEAQVDGDADSSSDSCEYAHERDMRFEAESPLAPPPQLPPSSGTIGVPEESVSHLFSVYGFLRSFSFQLFLCPFGLHDFVGAVNCSVPNSLMDAIHLALIRVLRFHLETLCSDGSEVASKCLRCIDWSLLDALTWPVYLLQYFAVMGYAKGPWWKNFNECVMDKEYYSLPVGMKLMTLQILCDDVLDCVDIRAEIDIREESEVGIDPDAVTSNLFENGPRRVHPRFSKTSACKDREAMEIVAEGHEMKSYHKLKLLGSKGTEGDADAVDLDPNSDECRLCGMDGTLLCCDGCPLAYHSRCIGVVKMYIPEGPWYCPECTINKMGPTITVGTSLKGAEVFGVDLYEQIFLGTCNHLLLLKASPSAEAHCRYYNLNDIPKVMHVLLSSAEHTATYSEICRAIILYWDIPEVIAFPQKTADMTHMKKNEITFVLPPLSKESSKASGAVEAENASSFTRCQADNVSKSCLGNSMNTMTLTNHCGNIDGSQDYPSVNSKLLAHIKMESAMTSSSVCQQADPCDLSCQSLVNMPNTKDCTRNASANSSCGEENSKLFPVNTSSQIMAGNCAGLGSSDRNIVNDRAYIGSCFKPKAYVNHYTNGDFASSAIANLTSLLSEESHVSESQKSGNARKFASSNIALQIKAFSSAASRFFWPSFEKKDIVRERCGWCHSCKLQSSSRRGCMLNAAVTNATKSAMKILNSLLPLRNGDGYLASVAAYLLYLEESLRGLVAGPFLKEMHRKQWCKQVEEATTCRAMRVLLLELGENICNIALSGDWFKLMDDWMVESSIIQSISYTVGTVQKRGPSGKRQKKQSEVKVDGCSHDSFSWWRGGKLSRHIHQKAILPRSMVRKAAHQGGVRRISGFTYFDGSEIPKRSRQLIWRTAVERSKNVSQLALQVRYLDNHVRWGDLVRPEQNLQDGKGPETEASAFRNANICDKRIVDSKMTYGVSFGNQKHVPARVMKNIIRVEQRHDGQQTYWFNEMRIPLYLIKEYEERFHEVLLPSIKKLSNGLSKLQKRQLKDSRRDIFSYLTCKRDKLEQCSCASCQLDVSLRNAVTCNVCQGYCHKDCTSSSICSNGKIELFITCKRCYLAKANAPNEMSNKYPNSLLLLNGREHSSAMTGSKGTQLRGSNQPLTSVTAQENHSEIKQSTPDPGSGTKSRRKLCSWGVIWKKKNNEDTGSAFRQANILLQGSSDKHLLEPICDLCQQPYNLTLTYIHCETCNKWYHSEAVELEDSKIPDVIGFKCCKCRRIRPPECPYMDTELREQKRRKRCMRAQKQGQGNVVISDSGTMSEPKELKSIYPVCPSEDLFVSDDDPLLFSLSKVEKVTENNSDFEWNADSGSGLKKLPVRRHVKQEGNVNGLSGSNPLNFEQSNCNETDNRPQTKEEQPFYVTEWDVSSTGLEGDMMFDYESLNYEDMEFEPQTYFSFTELLASDEGDQCGGVDVSGDALGNMENQSSSISHGVKEQSGIGNCGQQESTLFEKSNANAIQCQICLHMEPAPDLSCQICGFVIHSHCSPWEESLVSERSWSCGRCREWR